MVVGDYVPNQNEELFDDDEWVARIAYAFRATGAMSRGDSTTNYARNFLKEQYRLRPMSLSRILDYFTARQFVIKTAMCPPIEPIYPYKDRSNQVDFSYERVTKKVNGSFTYFEYKTVKVMKPQPPVNVNEFYLIADRSRN